VLRAGGPVTLHVAAARSDGTQPASGTGLAATYYGGKDFNTLALLHRRHSRL
jgi:hypothetical protein